METVKDNATTTALVVSNSEPIVITSKFTLPAPVFILFVEYLGYETPLIQWCEDICLKKDVKEFQKNVINIEAKNMLDKVNEEYSIDKIHQYFKELYDVAIDKWLTKYNENNLTNFKITF